MREAISFYEGVHSSKRFSCIHREVAELIGFLMPLPPPPNHLGASAECRHKCLAQVATTANGYATLSQTANGYATLFLTIPQVGLTIQCMEKNIIRKTS